jgi:hypothetical protein
MLINSADSSNSEFFCCSRLTVSFLKGIYQKTLIPDKDLQLLQFHDAHMDLENPETRNPGTSLGALVQNEEIEKIL